MKLKVNTKALIASTVCSCKWFHLQKPLQKHSSWVARSVDEIKHDIQQSGENQQTYTVKYGDTLSSIAEALGIDVHVLANLNNIRTWIWSTQVLFLKNNSKTIKKK